ncbi:hypothetical protein PC118_g7804 [Phytophthora cactorum]|uniref:Uncharacterized protein n=1 Tax=Phytophthora cactorum TaxID=29920 RepID=A0A8T1G1K9_9STRA|nr:hypothetical protein PC118_g7804 [Phytophthora cactorum]
MSAKSLTKRRFELFYYLLTGRLLRVEASVLPKMTNEDETEGKYAHQVKRERLTDSRLGASSIILKDFGLDASARRTELEQANGNRRHSSDQKLSTTHLDGQGTTRIDRGWVVLLGARM